MGFSSFNKLSQVLLGFAIAAQCGIADAKRVDRRLSPQGISRAAAPAAVQGRNMIGGLPVSTGLEIAPGYTGVSSSLPSSARVVAAAPYSCVPGTPNCVMPQQITANMTPQPAPPMWPMLLQAAMAGLKPSMGGLFGGSNDSARPRSSSRSSMEHDPIPPRPRSSRERVDDDTVDRPRTLASGPTDQGTVQPVLGPGQCQKDTVNLHPVVSAPALQQASVLTDKTLVRVKASGSDPLRITPPTSGIIEYNQEDQGDKITCHKSVKLIHLKCQGCIMKVSYVIAKNPTGDAGRNRCDQGSSAKSCNPLVTLGEKFGVTEAHVSIRLGNQDLTRQYLGSPATERVAITNDTTGEAAPTCGGAPGKPCPGQR